MLFFVVVVLLWFGFWLCVPKLWIEFELWCEGGEEKKKTCGIMICGMNNLEID